MADLISFNRLRNNVMKHSNTVEKRGKIADYYRLQMMLAKMKRGNVDFAKKMLKSIEKEVSQDNNDPAKKQNLRLARYLEYWTTVSYSVLGKINFTEKNIFLFEKKNIKPEKTVLY